MKALLYLGNSDGDYLNSWRYVLNYPSQLERHQLSNTRPDFQYFSVETKEPSFQHLNFFHEKEKKSQRGRISYSKSHTGNSYSRTRIFRYDIFENWNFENWTTLFSRSVKLSNEGILIEELCEVSGGIVDQSRIFGIIDSPSRMMKNFKPEFWTIIFYF